MCSSDLLAIYGDGPKRRSLQRLAIRSGLADRISFHGMVSNDVVQKALAKADCAVLPSRFDGWGMLVNEALAVGTQVICTSHCGAASLFAECGITASTVDPVVSDLGSALAAILKAGPLRPQSRLEPADRMRDLGSAKPAAQRFLFAAIPA